MWRSVLGELVFGHPVDDEDDDEPQHSHDNDHRLEPRCGGVVTMPPGYADDPKTVELARFAVAEHNKKTVRHPSNLRAHRSIDHPSVIHDGSLL
jgi:hypothetical protein